MRSRRTREQLLQALHRRLREVQRSGGGSFRCLVGRGRDHARQALHHGLPRTLLRRCCACTCELPCDRSLFSAPAHQLHMLGDKGVKSALHRTHL